MVRVKESPKEWGYAYKLNIQQFHKGIVKGNRVRVNVH
jgi:hypothetical protein